MAAACNGIMTIKNLTANPVSGTNCCFDKSLKKWKRISIVYNKTKCTNTHLNMSMSDGKDGQMREWLFNIAV